MGGSCSGTGWLFVHLYHSVIEGHHSKSVVGAGLLAAATRVQVYRDIETEPGPS